MVAMLALTLLPSVGRLAQYDAVDAATADRALAPLLGAMCTAKGIAYDPAVAVIESAVFLPADDDDRTPSAPHIGDCDYCTIAATSGVPASLAIAVPLLANDATQRIPSDRIVRWHYPLGLGSRGPPLTT